MCNISSKFMHAFLSNLADRQTDKQTRAKSFTSSFIGGKKKQTLHIWACYDQTPEGDNKIPVYVW